MSFRPVLSCWLSPLVRPSPECLLYPSICLFVRMPTFVGFTSPVSGGGGGGGCAISVIVHFTGWDLVSKACLSVAPPYKTPSVL
ncbi:hypothetical protein F4779DRAFT_595991, partial [Xylariaceae sp. FL0662B]